MVRSRVRYLAGSVSIKTHPLMCNKRRSESILFWDRLYLEQRSLRCLEMSGVSSACIMCGASDATDDRVWIESVLVSAKLILPP
jgi:hypothetical protein